jgi:DNA-binding transcriptional regulator YiaG
MDIDQTADLARIRDLAIRGTARRIRLKAGLSLAEVAEPCGVTAATVYRWEVGDRRPTGIPALLYLQLLDQLDGRKAPA